MTTLFRFELGKALPRILLLLLVLLLCPLMAAALSGAGPATIAVGEIRPGMRGYGLTVFSGTEPERFDVEVIDVLSNFRPDQDMILVRTKHPVLDRATTVAGMSGSPVYLEGKLAGAYAFGWLFGREPVAGVTPIANMLAELKRPLDPAIWRALGASPELSVGRRAPSTRVNKARAGLKEPGTRASKRRTGTALSRARARVLAGGLPHDWGRKRIGAFGALQQHAVRAGLSHQGSANLTVAGSRVRPGIASGIRPVATPILMGGLSEPVVEILDRELERFGLIALQAGGGQRRTASRRGVSAAGFENGSALGVQLIRGDLSATAIGTVTHVQGRRLLAFGHPMMNMGQIALPTATARVLHVLASERRSFKIAEPISPLGALVHDRQAAVVVDTKIKAPTIPVTVRVSGVRGAPRAEWHMEVASHRVITPILTFSAIANALRATASDRADVMVTATSRVGIQGHGQIQVQDIGHTATGLSGGTMLSQLRLFDLLEASYRNPFEETRPLSVEAHLDLRFSRDVVTIVDALVPHREVDPGAPVNVHVVLREFGGTERSRIVRVPIPASAAGEQVEIVLEPGNQVEIEQPKPENLDDIIGAVCSGYPSTSLVISTKTPSHGLRLRGHVVRALPGSAYDTLQLVNESDRPTPFATYERQALPLGKVVYGSARLKLDVRESPRQQTD